jgi:hypothetical protein
MGAVPLAVNAPFSRKSMKSPLMKTLRTILATALAASLAACSTAPGLAPPPPPAPVAPVAPQPWGWGYTATAEQDLVETFGPTSFKAGDFVWVPQKLPEGETKLVISLSRQRAYVYHDGKLIAASTISSGSKGHESPMGEFPILEKNKFHKSNRYSAAPMPFMQRLNRWGVALHGGHLPGYPASHGCIRLPMKFAEKLYSLTDVGDKVYVEG